MKTFTKAAAVTFGILFALTVWTVGWAAVIMAGLALSGYKI